MNFSTILARYVGIILLSVIAMGAGRSVLAQAPCNGKDALTAKSCAGDNNSADEQALFDLVSKYRAANALPSVRLSPSLSMVANRHIIDLVQNVKSFTHGWSNCPYDINVERTWPCVSDSPKRLNSGYPGQAFETLFRGANGKATPAQAMDAWKKSKLHNSIILNLDTFKDLPWDEVGVAMDNGYAVLWFGSPGRKSSTTAGPGNGLGVTYEQALAGVNKLLAMQVTSVGNSTKWSGLSANKKARLEVSGSPRTVFEVTVSITPGSNGKLGPDDQKIMTTLLRNLFPEWSDMDNWLNVSVAAILDDASVWRAKTVKGIKVDLRSDGTGALKLLVKP